MWDFPGDRMLLKLVMTELCRQELLVFRDIGLKKGAEASASAELANLVLAAMEYTVGHFCLCLPLPHVCPLSLGFAPSYSFPFSNVTFKPCVHFCALLRLFD